MRIVMSFWEVKVRTEKQTADETERRTERLIDCWRGPAQWHHLVQDEDCRRCHAADPRHGGNKTHPRLSASCKTSKGHMMLKKKGHKQGKIGSGSPFNVDSATEV